ncbi:MAG: hypothetical protein V5A43_00785 [Haloarculaceae archaeon]
MVATVHLSEPLGEHGATIECEQVEVRGPVVWLTPVEIEGEEHLVVPLENLAGVVGEAVGHDVAEIPTQGGQYSEVVTRVE